MTNIERRNARRRLAQELAAYRTTAEKQELESILARHPMGATTEVRAVLTRQAMLEDLEARRGRWLESA